MFRLRAAGSQSSKRRRLDHRPADPGKGGLDDRAGGAAAAFRAFVRILRLGGVKRPTREKIAATAGKAALIARLKESFQFCHTALAALDDSKLSEELTVFGEKMSRADLALVAAGDWADHYSQLAIYMRLNGLLPPTAKK